MPWLGWYGRVPRGGPPVARRGRCAIVPDMPDTTADLVFRGGHVHTVDGHRPRADAVAVSGERIVAVGSDGDVDPLIGPRTRVIDLAGGLLLPGFQDAHVHPIFGGMDRLQCDLRESRGRDGVLATIRAYVDAHPDAAWIVGSRSEERRVGKECRLRWS